MIIKQIKVGYLETNCYILEDNLASLIIDPGDDVLKIDQMIQKRVIGILLTHHHQDHVGGVDYLVNKFKCNVYDINNLKEGNNNIGMFNFNCIYTKGHSNDSISFLFNNNLFCGDFIFENAIGRTDLSTGNMLDMQNSIKKIIKYDDNIVIYPGHGNITSLKKEMSNLKSFL
jgi:hydroxyacylglutathione hydrolase